jgi:hypothetical protein
MWQILSYLQDKFGVRHLSAALGRGSDADRPPMELYAYAVVLFMRNQELILNVGFAMADSVKKAKAAGLVTALKAWEDRKVLHYTVHAHALTPSVLEIVKREYSLSDDLALWREELEKET